MQLELEPLPQQLWEAILEKLDDTHDKLNLIEANSALEKAFENQKVGWLFYEVLPLVIASSEKAVKNADDFRSLKQTYQNCRLISSDCSKVMDNYVKEYWARNQCVLQSIIPQLRLDSAVRFKEFYDKVRKDDVPMERLLPGRTLSVKCSGVYDPKTPGHDYVIDLLKGVGNILWSFNLTTEEFENLESICKTIHEVLSSCPNLRCFEYSYNHAVMEMDPEKLRNNESFEFPSLPNLKHLAISTGGTGIAPFPDFICFMPCFNQLTHLKLKGSMWKKQYNEAGKFPNLQYLELLNTDVLNEKEHNMITDVLMKVDVPQLKWFHLEMKASSDYDEVQKKAAFLGRFGIFNFQDRYEEDRNWTSQLKDRDQDDENLMTLMDLYDSDHFVLPAFINLKDVAPETPENEENTGSTGIGAAISNLFGLLTN